MVLTLFKVKLKLKSPGDLGPIKIHYDEKQSSSRNENSLMGALKIVLLRGGKY